MAFWALHGFPSQGSLASSKPGLRWKHWVFKMQARTPVRIYVGWEEEKTKHAL